MKKSVAPNPNLKHRIRSPHLGSDGFVLVAVLLLIAVAVVLVVTTSSVSQTERKAVSNSANQEIARQNALFALNLAVSQLQVAAGPDQRVTARAEILTNATVNQPYWTGVWKTGTSYLDVGASPQRTTSLGALNPTASQISTSATWLVSGATNNATINPISWSDPSSGQVLAQNYGANAATVTVPLVRMTNTYSIGSTIRTNVGGYAYWVSDEGVKAKVNEVAPTLGASFPDSQLHFQCPQGITTTNGLLGAANTSIDLRSTNYSNSLAKVTTLQSMQFVTSTITATPLTGTNASQLAADATTYSQGVIADVKNGGLKIDLTAALETQTAFTSLINTYGNSYGLVYRSALNAVPTFDPGVTPPVDGMQWLSLYFHYNSYKKTMPSPLATTTGTAPTSMGNPATLPNTCSTRVYSANNTGSQIWHNGLLPILLNMRIDCCLSAYTSGGLYYPILQYYPQLVLYNPYCVPISFANYQYQRNFAVFGTANGNAATISGTITDGATVTTIPSLTVNPGDLLTAAANANMQQFLTKSGDCDILQPGETRVFSLDISPLTAATYDNAMTFGVANPLKSNINASGDWNQSGIIPTGFAGTANKDATVALTLINRNLECNAIDIFALPSTLTWPTTSGSRIYNCGLASAAAGASSPSTPLSITNSLSTLLSSPKRIIGAYMRVKGLNMTPSPDGFTYNTGLMQIPIFMGNASPFNIRAETMSITWQEIYLSVFGSTYNNGATDISTTGTPNAATGPNLETWWGDHSAGYAETGPPIRKVLYDLPNQPMISLGQFMHMITGSQWTSSAVDFSQQYMGDLVVGGSLASPFVPTTQNQVNQSGGPSGVSFIVMDDSFLANDALFDRFFFSTVPPAGTAPVGTTWPSFWTSFNTANIGTTLTDATKPLLNARIKPYYTGGTNPPVMANLRDMNQASANLLLDGAFNVNSTSVQAWYALLSSLSGNDMKIYRATGVTTKIISTSGFNPIPRFWSASALANLSTTASPSPWDGLRALTPAETLDLAQKIVNQVKLRGPFLSISDFLNRRLGPNSSSLSLCGAIQAAIDTTSPDINAGAKAKGVPVNATGGTPAIIPSNMIDGAGNTYNTSIGMPGYLMQQDIVQDFSPVMTVRSDTFVIRVYGEARNPMTRAIEGTAYAEAVVQRTPEFMDQTDPALATLGNATAIASVNSTNQKLGRRFKIISFRWLNSNEI